MNGNFITIEHQPLPPGWPTPREGLTGYLATLVDTTQDDRCFLGFLAPPGLVPEGDWTEDLALRACAWVAHAALEEKEDPFAPMDWLKEAARGPGHLEIRAAGKAGPGSRHPWPMGTGLEALAERARADLAGHALDTRLPKPSPPAAPPPRI